VFFYSAQNRTHNALISNKKLSYHRGTVQCAMLVTSCCFTRYGS